MPAMPNDETPAQAIAADFNIIAEEIPTHYAMVAQAMMEHAKANTAADRDQTAGALAVALIQAPPELLHCLSENLKQVNDPEDFDEEEIASSIAVHRGEDARFYTDFTAQWNRLDDDFWHTVISEQPAQPEPGQPGDRNSALPPICVTVERTPIEAGTTLVKLTATANFDQGQTVVGRAMTIEESQAT